MAADVALGKAIVFPVAQAKEIARLRVSPVRVIEEKKKLRVIHDFTFGGGVTVRKGEGGRV